MSEREYYIWAPNDLWLPCQRSIHKDFPDYMQDYMNDWEFENHNLSEWVTARKLFFTHIKPWRDENVQRIMMHVSESHDGWLADTIHCHPLPGTCVSQWMKIAWARFDDDADAVKFKLQMEQFRLTPTDQVLLKD